MILNEIVLYFIIFINKMHFESTSQPHCQSGSRLIMIPRLSYGSNTIVNFTKKPVIQQQLSDNKIFSSPKMH
jgi:hypothetical protein